MTHLLAATWPAWGYFLLWVAAALTLAAIFLVLVDWYGRVRL